MHGDSARGAGLEVAVEEVDPTDGARRSRKTEHTAVGLALEREPPSRRERRPVAESEPHVEHLQVAAFDHEADVLEPIFPRCPEDVVVRAEVHLSRTQMDPFPLQLARSPRWPGRGAARERDESEEDGPEGP